MRKIFCIALFFACSCSNADKVPSGIIPKAKMEKIMWDMLLADRYSTQYLQKDTAKIDFKAETFKLYSAVFALHQVSAAEFRKSFTYYLSRPDITRNMFDSLSVRGSRDRDTLFRKMRVD